MYIQACSNWKLFILILLYSGNMDGIDLHGFVHIAKGMVLTDSLAFIQRQSELVLYGFIVQIFFFLTNSHVTGSE